MRATLNRAAATTARRWILAVTAVLCLGTPVLLALLADPVNHTFATISATTQSLVSIPLPFLTALLGVEAALSRAGAPGSVSVGRGPSCRHAGHTPLPSATHLLRGDMSGPAWPQWLVMVLIWVVGLNQWSASAAFPGAQRQSTMDDLSQ